MSDTLIKFAGGQCQATSSGSKNPVAGMMAQMILSGPEFAVSHAQDIQAQSVGTATAMNQVIGGR